jgi:hypothetical protein
MKTGRPKKYTFKYCLAEIREISGRLFADGASGGAWTYITWHDLIKDKPYSRQRVSEWREAFKKNAEFSDTIKKVEEELENRLYKLGLKGKANQTVVIFGLKNNYGWKDRTEYNHNVNTSGVIEINYIVPDEDSNKTNI